MALPRRLAWVCVLGLSLVLLWHEWFGPDIWYHLFLGRRIIQTGHVQPTDLLILQQSGFINVYWLFQIASYEVYSLGGLIGLSALMAAVWLVALGVWGMSAGIFRSPWGGAVGLVALLWALWTVKLFWVAWAAIVGIGIRLAVRNVRAHLFSLVLAAAGLWLSASAFRNIPFLVFFSGPLLCAVVQEDRVGRTGWRLTLILGVGTAFACLILGVWAVNGGLYESLASETAFGVRESESSYPVEFSEYLRGISFTGPLFNDSSDGGYLEFRFPALKLYGDSRFTEAAPVREYFAAVRDPASFERLQEKHHFTGVLLPIASGRPVISALWADPRWRIAYADLHRVFFLAQSVEGVPVIEHLPSLYHGEDTGRRRDGLPATEWTRLLAHKDDRIDLLESLREFRSSPRIPSYIPEFSLAYAVMHSDREVAAAARALIPKMFAPEEADRKAVLDLLLKAKGL